MGFFLSRLFLYDLGYSLQVIDLDIYVLGENSREMVKTGATEPIRLLWHPKTLDLNILACLGYIAEFNNSWMGC